jgi:hypothetical protein
MKGLLPKKRDFLGKLAQLNAEPFCTMLAWRDETVQDA